MEVRAKKFLGQHFLRDENIARSIVEALPRVPADTLEIGPGMGVLTRYLMADPERRVQVVEIDRESVKYLHEHYPDLEIHAEDFLRMKLRNLYTTPFSVIGNFPYNISSQILFKVLDNKDCIPCVVGMFQKEVAERIAAKSGSKTYGILSVLLQAYYDIEYLFTVDEHVFSPPPKVKSAVIRLQRNQVERLDCDETFFFKVVKTAFNQRRKTLRNALSGLVSDKSMLQADLFQKRAEQLSVADFVYITQHLAHGKAPSTL